MAGSRNLTACIFGLCFPCVVFALRQVLSPYGEVMAPSISNLGSDQPDNLSKKRKIPFITGPAKVQGLTLYPRLIFKLPSEQITQEIKGLLPRKPGTDSCQAGKMASQGRDHLEVERRGLKIQVRETETGRADRIAGKVQPPLPWFLLRALQTQRKGCLTGTYVTRPLRSCAWGSGAPRPSSFRPRSWSPQPHPFLWRCHGNQPRPPPRPPSPPPSRIQFLFESGLCLTSSCMTQG